MDIIMMISLMIVGAFIGTAIKHLTDTKKHDDESNGGGN